MLARTKSNTRLGSRSSWNRGEGQEEHLDLSKGCAGDRRLWRRRERVRGERDGAIYRRRRVVNPSVCLWALLPRPGPYIGPCHRARFFGPNFFYFYIIIFSFFSKIYGDFFFKNITQPPVHPAVSVTVRPVAGL